MKFSEFLSEAALKSQNNLDDYYTDNMSVDGQNIGSLTKLVIPQKIGGMFSCRLNQLTTLKGGPKTVLHDYKASKNLLSNFDGFPEFVGMTMWLLRNKFVSLHNIHKSLKECHGGLILEDNPIKSHILGVLLIKELAYVRMDNLEIEEIINKYLPNTRGNDAVIDCQNELLDAGFEEYAQL